MNILKNAVSHGYKKRHEDDPVVVKVPEWGDDEPAVIYVFPATIRQMSAIKNAMYNEGDIVSLVETLVQRAADNAGEPIFKAEHRDTILDEFDLEVVARAVAEMCGEDVSVEEIELEAGKK